MFSWGFYLSIIKIVLQKSTLAFLQKLKKNNNKAWMDANRNLFEAAKLDFRHFVQQLITEIGKFDRDIAELEAKQCIFRQNRDIRFSKDKSPYKTAMGAFMNKGGKKASTAGYYFHAEPGNCFLAGGLWMPEADQLSKVRQELDYNLTEWNKLINAAAFKKHFSNGFDQSCKLSRPPKGYDADNPALPFLLLKSFTVSMPLEDAELLNKNLIKQTRSAFKSLQPVISFLNQVND